MRANTGRLEDALNRLAPFIVVVVVVTIAYFLFLQEPLHAYFRSRTDAASLQSRVKTLQNSRARAVNSPPVDLQASVREYEKQMADSDRVSDVSAILAKAVLDHAPAGKLRGFSIETSDRISVATPTRQQAPAVTPGNISTIPDPRLSLFPGTVSYTPLKMTFSSTFEAIAAVIWKLQGLPTMIEIKSATLTRGLPLMKIELLLWVYQRAEPASQDPGATPPPVTPTPAPAPAGPRVARLMGAEG